ncbi:rifin [Plasmodium sp. gorilla clade G1]|nr:rifin [Plasmodium sp. gorilla clade G1]
MKFSYLNILLCSVNLNIFLSSSHENNQKNRYSTVDTPKNTKIPTTRLLCEYDIYTCNYDNDPEMKTLKEDFDDRAAQRFREYEDRMQGKRQKCKEQCEKDIEKIILKDKIEKKLAQEFSTLQTDIDVDDIPTCVCEKSLADKMEKSCLRCGRNLGGFVPGLGILGCATTYFQYLDAMAAATQAGIKAGADVGIQKALNILNTPWNLKTFNGVSVKTLLNADNFKNPMFYVSHIQKEYNTMCESNMLYEHEFICFFKGLPYNRGPMALEQSAKDIAKEAGQAAAAETATVTKAGEDAASATSTIVSNFFTNPIGISIITIIIIVVLMLIIYLILRYRRNQKMRKKIQYIKLLKE